MSDALAVRTLAAADHPRWMRLVNESPQGTLFHSTDWLDAVGQPYELLGCFRGDELRGGMPVGVVAPRTVGHPEPWLTAYLGPLLPPPEERPVATQSTHKAVTAALAAYVKGAFDAGSFRCVPEVVDLQPFIWEGFNVGVRYTYRLSVRDLEAVQQGMDATRRRNLRAAERDGLVVESPADFRTLLQLSAQTFQRQGREPEFHAAASRIESALAVQNRCRAFVARDGSGRPVGGVWTVWDDRRAYYLIGGHDHAAGRPDGTALAMWHAIQFTSRDLHLLEFDFEGSMVPSIERFFRKFGGVLRPTYTVSWQPPPGGLARKVARRIMGRD